MKKCPKCGVTDDQARFTSSDRYCTTCRRYFNKQTRYNKQEAEKQWERDQEELRWLRAEVTRLRNALARQDRPPLGPPTPDQDPDPEQSTDQVDDELDLLVRYTGAQDPDT